MAVMRRLVVALVIVLLSTAALAANKKAEEQLSDLKFSVVKADNGKPVRNASIVLHPVDDHGQQRNSGFQLKTDAEGRALVSSIPYGKLRVQVIASGYQTYGQDHEINQATHEFVIKLNRPQTQYSIYK